MLNWANLVVKGRARDIGIGWNEVEWDALLKLEKERGLARATAAEYMRRGIETVEDYDKDIEEGNKIKTREELEKEAKELGIEFAPEAPNTVLKKEIERKKIAPILPPTNDTTPTASIDISSTNTTDTPPVDVVKGESEKKVVDKDFLRARFEELGITYDGRKSIETLTEILNEHTSKEQ